MFFQINDTREEVFDLIYDGHGSLKIGSSQGHFSGVTDERCRWRKMRGWSRG
jgi:hypothetical protein